MDNQNQNSKLSQETISIQVPSIDNITSRRQVIPVSFALAILFFFFTFCDFKCGEQKIGSVSGINLVTGTELHTPNMFSGTETKGNKIPANIWAILAFGAAIVGLGAFLMKEKREDLIGASAGAIGAGALIILHLTVNAAIKKDAEGRIEVDFQFAYWCALIALGVAGFISYLRMKKIPDVAENLSLPLSPKATDTEES